jgi:hypothetical protein
MPRIIRKIFPINLSSSINCDFCDRHMGYIFLKADKLDEAQEQSTTLMKLAAIAMYSDCFAFRNHKIEDKK